MACINRLLYCTVQIWASNNLVALKDTFAEARRFYQKHDCNVTLLMLLSAEKIVLGLIGRESESLTDSEWATAASMRGSKFSRQALAS